MKVPGPDIGPVGKPADRGTPVRPRASGAEGAAVPPAAGDTVSISPLAAALSELQRLEPLRPEAVAAAQRLLDDQGNLHDVEALRTGLARLLELLGA